MRLTLDKLYGEIVVLMTYCATANVDYLSSNECANRFKNILENIKEYKDIEEELGIDLITLYKILNHGFYVRRTSGRIRWVMTGEFMLYKDGMSEGWECPTTFYFKDYGKTWALTEKELEQ